MQAHLLGCMKPLAAGPDPCDLIPCSLRSELLRVRLGSLTSCTAARSMCQCRREACKTPGRSAKTQQAQFKLPWPA